MTKKMPTQKIPIRLDFEGEDAERFQTVKDSRGVKANNELIRLLIADAYSDIQQKKTRLLEVAAR